MNKSLPALLILVSAFLVGCNGKNWYRQHSPVMEPSIPLGSMIKIDPEAYIKSNPERYDLIAFEVSMKTEGDKWIRQLYPQENWIVFRVLGLPGEKVKIKEGKEEINDQEIIPLEGLDWHPIEKEGRYEAFNEYQVPEGEYFVVGDRPKSLDSRYWGGLPKSWIRGKVIEIKIQQDGSGNPDKPGSRP